jgi:lysosomal acid lipase/cholesteryl ester hydrolase
MALIPVLGRLHPLEYLALLGSLVFLLLELLLRIVTLALPDPVINLCYRASRRLFNYLASPSSKRSNNKKKTIVHSIVRASDFVELCHLNGYQAEEHVVQTEDGYFLGLHRLAYRKGEEGVKVNSGRDSVQKKVIFCMHGLLMNSEVWVCQTDKERCLPFRLVDQGYDVWFGNNRGNKYSKKSTRFTPTETDFWAFSIDQFAFRDIPDSIKYILDTTGQPLLSYLGFSQGTAQAFASLSIHPYLNEKVDIFVALAPAMSPPGLSSGLVNSLVKASPNFLFLAFGRRSILSSAPMWEAILYPPIFVRLVDMGNRFLFGWRSENMSPHQKLAAYPHLYSFTSTKSVVHWFQIIRNGKFQMYDDEIEGPFSVSNTARYYKVAKFPTRNIRTPIVMLYGGSDSLVDINVMLKELPRHTEIKEVPHYEHLDFLWASDVQEEVFPHVFEALEKYTGAQLDETLSDGFTTGHGALRHRMTPKVPSPGRGPNDDDETPTDSSATLPQKHSQSLAPSSSSKSPSRVPVPIISRFATGDASISGMTERTSTSRPEGWWSSDEVGPSEPATPGNDPSPLTLPENTSGTDGSASLTPNQRALAKKPSQSSFDLAKVNERGISIGASKAVGGIIRDGGATATKVGSGGEASNSGSAAAAVVGTKRKKLKRGNGGN